VKIRKPNLTLVGTSDLTECVTPTQFSNRLVYEAELSVSLILASCSSSDIETTMSAFSCSSLLTCLCCCLAIVLWVTACKPLT
jgi:hypothetical protein